MIIFPGEEDSYLSKYSKKIGFDLSKEINGNND